MGKDSRKYGFNSGNRAWYVESKGGLDATSVSERIKGGRWKTCEKGEQDCLGQQDEKIRNQDPLGPELQGAEG
jgi:hypothetical protein